MKKKPFSQEIKLPSKDQLENSAMFGWKYEGDGLFSKDNLIGWFTEKTFVKE